MGSLRLARALGTFIVVAVGFSGCALVARQATIVYMDVDTDLSGKYIDMTLDRSFIEAYKNRVTIDAKFIVDKGAGKPLPRELDGDLHIAGRSPEIELPTIAEIANAADEKAAVDAVHAVEADRHARSKLNRRLAVCGRSTPGKRRRCRGRRSGSSAATIPATCSRSIRW